MVLAGSTGLGNPADRLLSTAASERRLPPVTVISGRCFLVVAVLAAAGARKLLIFFNILSSHNPVSGQYEATHVVIDGKQLDKSHLHEQQQRDYASLKTFRASQLTYR